MCMSNGDEVRGFILVPHVCPTRWPVSNSSETHRWRVVSDAGQLYVWEWRRGGNLKASVEYMLAKDKAYEPSLVTAGAIQWLSSLFRSSKLSLQDSTLFRTPLWAVQAVSCNLVSAARWVKNKDMNHFHSSFKPQKIKPTRTICISVWMCVYVCNGSIE
jgi:hypothetical protein